MKVSKSADLIKSSTPVVFNSEKNSVRKAMWQERVVFLFRPKYRTEQVEKIVNFVAKKLSKLDSGDKFDDYKKVWDACVVTYQKDKKLSKMLEEKERKVCKKCEDFAFQHFQNQALVSKMKRNGYDPDIFRNHPEFTLFLENSGLLSQMKATRDTIEIKDGEPSILVEGKRMPWSELKEKFRWELAVAYNNEKFIYCQDAASKNNNEVYTYLDNGKGLQKHHPYIDKELIPVSTLDDADYEKTLSKAKEFVRAGESPEDKKTKNEKRDFILQIVTSKTKGPNTNFHNLIKRSRHSYIRLIVGRDNPDIGTKKGEVYEVGFGHFGIFNNLAPFSMEAGKFRSPDVWEYMPCIERIVTNIALKQKEANSLYRFIDKHHKDRINLGRRIGFHILKQNCTVFVRKACEAARVKVPTEIELPELICKIAPQKIQRLGRIIKQARKKIVSLEGRAVQIFPEKVKNFLSNTRLSLIELIKKISGMVVALSLLPANFFLGGLKGENGDAFNVDGKKKADGIAPPLKKVRSWYKLSTYSVNLPGVLQEWQRQQASTEIYQDRIKLAIVPN